MHAPAFNSAKHDSVFGAHYISPIVLWLGYLEYLERGRGMEEDEGGYAVIFNIGHWSGFSPISLVKLQKLPVNIALSCMNYIH